MKKLICFLFAFLFLLSAAGCGGKPIDTTWMEDPDTTVSRVSSSEALDSGALNEDRMTISSVLHFPIYKFDTLEELTQFKDSLDYPEMLATVYKGNIIKNLIMDCQSYTKYRPNETTGGIFVSWRRKEELPTGA